MPAEDSCRARIHRGTPAVQRLVEYAPGSGGLALWVAHQDVDDPAQTACVVTDGQTLFYAPQFDRLPLPEQTGWVAHAVLHVAFRHVQRMVALRGVIGDVDALLFNVCADAIVNSALAHLGWLALPPGAVLLEDLLEACLGVRAGAEQALLSWDVERLYRAIDDRQASPSDRGGRTERQRADGPRAARARAQGRQGWRDLVVGPATLAAPEREAEQARAWTERVIRAHTGDAAFSLLRTLPADLARPRTPWQHLLRARLARALADRRTVSWSRPTRSWLANQGRIGAHGRLPWEPGTSAQRSVPRLVVIVDVSGSIEEGSLARFAAELAAIMRRLAAALVVILGDDAVREIRHWRPGQPVLADIRFDGGGGTDFVPLLQAADRFHPDLVLVLTDLQGPAGARPRWPVLWAVPVSHAHAEVPFGRRIVLD